jgi:molybdopterin/thiamine biosynthesis adenylyltransferase
MRAGFDLAESDARLVAVFGDDLARLRRKKVAILGLGTTGGPVSHQVAMLRIPQMLVDPGLVDAPNLGTQLFPAAALGRAKAVARASQIQALAPGAPVEAHRARAEELGLGAFAGCDAIVTCVDTRAARVRACEMAQLLGLPWLLDCALDGSGERLLGSVALYAPRDPAAACYACRLDRDELGEVFREGRPAGCPSWADPGVPSAPPTLAAAALASVVAGFVVLWLIRALLGRAEALAGRQLRIGADGEPRVALAALPRSSRCPLPHRRLAPLRPAPSDTVGGLLAAARADLGRDPEALRFHGRVLVAGLRCPVSGQTLDVLRLREALAKAELRCTCRAPEHERVPLRLLERLDAASAERYAERRFSELGFPPSDVLTATARGGEEVHYLLDGRRDAR